jgi:hypothetical protein
LFLAGARVKKATMKVRTAISKRKGKIGIRASTSAKTQLMKLNARRKREGKGEWLGHDDSDDGDSEADAAEREYERDETAKKEMDDFIDDDDDDDDDYDDDAEKGEDEEDSNFKEDEMKDNDNYDDDGEEIVVKNDESMRKTPAGSNKQKLVGCPTGTTEFVFVNNKAISTLFSSPCIVDTISLKDLQSNLEMRKKN